MSGPRQGNPPPPPPEVMTIDELAVYLQVSESSLYKLAQDGKVPGQKVGRHWRFGLRDQFERAMIWREKTPTIRQRLPIDTLVTIRTSRPSILLSQVA